MESEKGGINSMIHDSLFMIPRSNRRGSTLLLALVILGGIVASSFAIGTATTNRLRGAHAVDQSVVASYAAESGVEELLYAVRREGRRESLDANGSLESGASWARTVEATTREHFLTLEENGVGQLDLLPISGTIAPVGVRTLLITAQAPASDAWLDVTWVPFLASGDWSSAVGRVLLSPAELQNRKTIDLHALPTDGAPIAYRVRFHGLGGRIGTLSVRAASDAGGANEVRFPSRIRATVVGRMGSAQYATRVEFPAWVPVASVFDYVVFSECDIVKGGTITCP